MYRKCWKLIKLASIFKTSNGIFHQKKIFYVTRLSMIGSIFLVLGIIMVFLLSINSLGSLVKVNQFFSSIDLFESSELISPPKFHNETVMGNYFNKDS